MTKSIKEKLLPKFFTSISVQEKINFARHLSVGIKSGLPILDSLRMIQEQTESKKLKKTIEIVIQDVNNGQSLAQSLSSFGTMFGPLFVNMVKVGEASGNLAESLLYLSQEFKKQLAINRSIKSALAYPMIVLIATVGITIFLTAVIFPKILPIFASLRVELPFTTRIVITLLSFLRANGLYLLGGFIIFIILLKLILNVKKVHLLFDHFVLEMPIVATLVKNLTIANFTRSLSILLKSGMTITDALTIAKGTFHNMYYAKQVDNILETVKRGENIARYLKTQPKLFPPMLVGMINVGETTGNLEANLLYLSEYYTEEVETSVHNLTGMLEPILILGMGIVVGFIALAIIMPIYSITQGLQVK